MYLDYLLLKKKKKAPLHEEVFGSLMSFGMCKYQAGESMGKKINKGSLSVSVFLVVFCFILEVTAVASLETKKHGMLFQGRSPEIMSLYHLLNLDLAKQALKCSSKQNPREHLLASSK